jgi:hypothetical protein
MTNLIFKILYKLFSIMKLRYPVIHTPEDHEDALYHIHFYLRYGWVPFPIWIVQILYRECITDGHLKRILEDKEGPGSLLDFKTDLLTRFAGLALPALIQSLLAIGILCIS